MVISAAWKMLSEVGSDDGEGVPEVVDMIGVMVITVLDALAEHDLLRSDSPIKSFPNICLILLEEVVRLCDEAGIELERSCR